MAHPLPLSYNWRTPSTLASVGAVVCVGVVLRGSAEGRWGVAAVLVGLWAVCLLTVWARTRARLVVDGPRLHVRRFWHEHTVAGADLLRVEQFRSPHGPCYRLVVRTADGGERAVVAPVALLRAGHSTLFAWILARAPQAVLDRGAEKTLDQLRVRGLVT